jgi:hypothetical protein
MRFKTEFPTIHYGDAEFFFVSNIVCGRNELDLPNDWIPFYFQGKIKSIKEVRDGIEVTIGGEDYVDVYLITGSQDVAQMKVDLLRYDVIPYVDAN